MLAVCAFLTSCVVSAREAPPTSADAIGREVEALIATHDIPGLAVAIVAGDATVYEAYRGLADVAAKRPMASTTPFELASNADAFTAVAVLQLEEEHRLSLADPVSKHLPWFWVEHEGERRPVTLEQLLHHTSGLPERPTAPRPAASNDALEAAVRALVGARLRSPPGRAFAHAQVNYDVLALVVQIASGRPYASYLQEQVLAPLGLAHTFAGGWGAHPAPIGYKPCFGTACRVDGPAFAAVPPSARVVSTPEDMIRWARLQLRRVPAPPPLASAIARTHAPDLNVLPSPRGSFYAAGWSLFPPVENAVLSHVGRSPGFASYVGLLPGEGAGVIVLANANDARVSALGENIVERLRGRPPLHDLASDPHRELDKAASALGVVAALATLAVLGLTARQLHQLARRRRRWVAPSASRMLGVVVSLALLGMFGLFLYELPALFFQGLPWDLVRAWAPETLPWAVGLVAAMGATVFLQYVTATFTRSRGEGVWGWLTVFSALGGAGNALLIVVINETFVRRDDLRGGLLLGFLFGLALYVVGQRFVRRRIVEITSELLLEERKKLLRALRGATFQEFEKIGRGELVTSIGQDIDVISSSLGVAVTGLTHVVALLCCFAYLAFMKPLGLVVALTVVGVSAWGYVAAGNHAEAKWEHARSSQSRFFELLNQLLDGFKELRLSGRKRADFHDEIGDACEAYKTHRVRGELRFADVFVAGELLFMAVVGVIVFAYPLLFPDLGEDTIRNYVVVFLYMGGPFNELLHAYPEVLRMRVSWRRVKALSLALTEAQRVEGAPEANAEPPDEVHIEVRDLTFEYGDEHGRTFTFGPVSCTFSPGQLTFITGGNGSGKSTFAKLITGLYAPSGGTIRLNGVKATQAEVSERFSTVFSDFHLFDRLYGVDTTGREEEIRGYLERLELQDIVTIEDGRFSTTRLSAGQRRRLALLVSYLEDRPACLYDEWAADQDPHYRAYFYRTILPELRARRKCVIVITHDDRYFEDADQLLKLEFGRIVDAPRTAIPRDAVPEEQGSLA